MRPRFTSPRLAPTLQDANLKNEQLIKDEILSHSNGYIEKP